MYTDADKVANVARNIEVTGGRAATMTPDQMQDFINWAESEINSRLGALYYTPLRQIIRNNVTKYPDPIEMIATNLAAGYAVEAVLSRIEPVVSDAGKVHKENAMKTLDELVEGNLIGSRRLEGQTLKARNPFVPPSIAPLNTPKSQGF